VGVVSLSVEFFGLSTDVQRLLVDVVRERVLVI
jgi:hypothetical protein